MVICNMCTKKQQYIDIGYENGKTYYLNLTIWRNKRDEKYFFFIIILSMHNGRRGQVYGYVQNPFFFNMFLLSKFVQWKLKALHFFFVL